MSWLATLVLAAASLSAQDGRKLTAEPDRRVEIDLQHFYPAKKLQVALASLAAAYPELVRVEMLGTSRGGSELALVTVARFDAGDPKDRPGMLVVGSLGRDDLFGAELALATIAQILQDNSRDAAVASILERSTLYFVPCLDPDLRERAFAELEGAGATASARATTLDRNFPALWDPLRVADAGPYPLSEPEARALAEFLIGRPNIAIVQRYRAGEARAASLPSDWPAVDLEAHRVLAGDSGVQGLEGSAGGEGSCLTFAYLQQGAFVFVQPIAFASSGTWALPSVLEIQPLGRAAAGSTLKLAQALPHLVLTTLAVENLGEEQWSVELELANTGRLPTASALGRERVACDPPRISLEGAKLVAAALVEGDAAEPTSCSATRVELAEIGANRSRRVRLFVAAPVGSTLTFTASAPRAGRATATATLE